MSVPPSPPGGARDSTEGNGVTPYVRELYNAHPPPVTPHKVMVTSPRGSTTATTSNNNNVVSPNGAAKKKKKSSKRKKSSSPTKSPSPPSTTALTRSSPVRRSVEGDAGGTASATKKVRKASKGGDGATARDGKTDKPTVVNAAAFARPPQEQKTDNAIPTEPRDMMEESIAPKINSEKLPAEAIERQQSGRASSRFSERLKRQVDSLAQLNEKGVGFSTRSKVTSAASSTDRRGSRFSSAHDLAFSAYADGVDVDNEEPFVEAEVQPSDERYRRTTVLLEMENSMVHKRPGDVRSHIPLRRPTIMSDNSDDDDNSSTGV